MTASYLYTHRQYLRFDHSCWIDQISFEQEMREQMLREEDMPYGSDESEFEGYWSIVEASLR